MAKHPTQFNCPQLPCLRLAILDLLNQPLDVRIFDPIKYLGASHEIFGITLIITWVVTLIWFPEQIFEHPARPIIGSFNPCFGWDYPPASYIALVGCSINVYFTWRYAWLERTRTHLRNPSGKLKWHEHFSNITCVILAWASNFWLLLWLLGPASTGTPDAGVLKPAEDVDAWFMHTGLFTFYASGSYLAVLGNYCEVRFGPAGASRVQRKHTIFTWLYGFAAAILSAASNPRTSTSP